MQNELRTVAGQKRDDMPMAKIEKCELSQRKCPKFDPYWPQNTAERIQTNHYTTRKAALWNSLRYPLEAFLQGKSKRTQPTARVLPELSN